jgi:hypothetical protein
MIIEIQDDIPAEERKKRLIFIPIAYALCKFEFNKKMAAEWLGISERGVRDKMYRDSELKYFIKERIDDSREEKTPREIMDRQAMVIIQRFENSFDYKIMTEKKRKEVIRNIKKNFGYNY